MKTTAYHHEPRRIVIADTVIRFCLLICYAIAGALAGQFIRMHGWALTTRPHHRRFAA